MSYGLDGQWRPEDDSVEQRLGGLLSPNNPLMKQARLNAMQGANQRGLLNSSMANQAGMGAMMQAALPIASQDASQIHKQNLVWQGTQDQMRLADHGLENEMALNEQRQRQQQTLDAINHQRSLEMQQMDMDYRERMQNLQISSQERSAALNAAINFNNTYDVQWRSINSNESLAAADREAQLNEIWGYRDANTGLIEQIYNIDLQW